MINDGYRLSIPNPTAIIKTTHNMLEHYRTYYNFIREHSELGKTPSEEAGIELTDNKNRWMGLLEQVLSQSEGN